MSKPSKTNLTASQEKARQGQPVRPAKAREALNGLPEGKAMKSKTFPHAPAQALVPGRGGRGRKAMPVPPADAPEPKPFPCQAARATEAPRSAGTGVALKAASVPQVPGLLDERVLGCTYGHYPWDDWERTALAAGVPKSLAGLGRLTMREAYQHQWNDRLKSLCGWCDGGRRMTRLALRSPQTAEKRWQRLLDTDGYRGCWRTLPGDPPTLTWESWT